MSITAGWITVAVMFFRILLKKMPKHFTCMLWALVGLRLVIPFSPESAFSLIPSAETIPETLPHGAIPEIHSGISTIDRMVNPAAKISFSQLSAGRSGAEALDILADGAVILWLAGVLLMLCHMILSYLRLRRKMRTAVLLRDNIWQSEFAASPFLLGLASPRIYVPFHMDRETLSHVIAHENAHLARKDHLVKAFAFCLLSVYWFHPLLWAAYALLCRDIELACDERVIRNMEEKERKMKDQVNVLFVCGYGLGSSAVAEMLVKKGLVAEGVNAEVKHTAVGELNSLKDWADVVAISKKLAEGLTFDENTHLVEVVNIMDGAGIAKQIAGIVDEYYPAARK